MSLTKPKVSLGKFHHICGKNIQFSEERTVAERVLGWDNGIVYSEKPLPVNTTFQIKLLQKQDLRMRNYKGSLALGLTTENPDKTLLVQSYLDLALHSHQNYWFLHPDGRVHHGTFQCQYPLYIERSLEVGQSVGCVVNENGELHFFLDGKDKGVACTGLPTDQPLWGFVDISAKAEKIKSEFYIHPKQQCQNCLQLEQQLSSETSRLRDEASQMQEDFHRHIQGLEERLQETEQQLDQKREEVEEKEQEMQVLQQSFDTAMAELQLLRLQLHTSPQVASQQGIEAWKVPRDEVQILGELDRGAWGVVARGRFRGQLVAVKSPHPTILNEHTIERLRREVRIMAQLHHPNLLHFIAAVFDNRLPRLPPLIVMELLDINLRAAYQNGRLSDVTKMPIFQDVAYALHYLHEHQEPIIHRDVSAPNVLLEELPNRMWRAKISDFGSANLAKMAQTMGEGAIIYAAPETIPQAHDLDTPLPPQTTKIDTYSYGVLLCEVTTGQFPDPARYRVMLRQIQSQWLAMHELIVHCTKRNSEDRPTMAQVLEKLRQLPRQRS